MDPVLEMRGISKRFPGVQALSNVDFKLYSGEITSIIGQNGAGKSTLMKILSGNYQKDEGTILIHGKEVEINNTADAARLGIGIVYQELSLLNNLTVAENIFLGREIVNGIRLDNKKMNELAEQYLRDFGIENIEANKNVEIYPLAKQQLIEIVKVLSHKPDILILDEPTAALTNEDTERLFRILFQLKEQGICVVFISHRLGEIKRYCDSGTILMNGRVTANVRMEDVDELKIIEHMLGDSFNAYRKEIAQVDRTEPVLELRDICLKNRLDHASCKIYKSEIAGFVGLLGAGQDLLWRVAYGALQADSGQILVKGKARKIKSPARAVQCGIGLLTENRKEEGLFADMSVLDNIALPSLRFFKLSPVLPFLNYRKIRKKSTAFSDKLAVKMSSIHTKVQFLSGGNQQKAIVSRWLLRDLDVLVFIEPTRGVDVGAKAEIYKILEELAKEGKAIVVISTDTTEILQLSDRIFVMCGGKVSNVIEGRTDEETLARMIQGKEAAV
ncbi:MAG: sugar ABC transporter ATP-binding protein [Oscillospiraceae bacterium]|nr:sugar ABC transporter ATP-binding protein [Oscillospiraceae bacterium]